jgi:hypothetical protein
MLVGTTTTLAPVMTALHLELDSPNIVLRGNFNPSILQPAWLGAHNLIRSEEAEKAKVEIIAEPVSSFTVDWLQLQMTHDRFSATSDAANARPLRDLVLGIFKLLEHTPLTSLGINRNMHFKMQSTDDWHTVGHRLVPKEAWERFLTKPGMLSVAVRGKPKARPHAVLNVKVEPSARVPDGVYVSINEHYQESGDGGGKKLLRVLETAWDDAQREGKEIAEGILAQALGAQA